MSSYCLRKWKNPIMKWFNSILNSVDIFQNKIKFVKKEVNIKLDILAHVWNFFSFLAISAIWINHRKLNIIGADWKKFCVHNILFQMKQTNF